MNDEPKRWLDDGASSFERELLSSADVDRAPSRALSRTLASVQIAAAATLVAGSAAGTSAGLSAVGVLKWVGIGVVSGLATMVAVETVTPTSPRAASPARERETTLVAARAVPAPEKPRAAEPAPAPAPALEPRSTRNSAAVREPDAPTATPTTPTKTGPDLARETALVSEASRRVEANDPARALALLDQYRREYPNGVLGPEAAVVRVRALVASGRQEEAERMAASHAASEPGSAHARSMQRALDEKKRSMK